MPHFGFRLEPHYMLGQPWHEHMTQHRIYSYTITQVINNHQHFSSTLYRYTNAQQHKLSSINDLHQNHHQTYPP